ncbi:hypothetical protein OPIT5_09180 [Opitutaceae bacterium TAV5]|nr:hypothetical protein OPIT5_09180 [Opitutaceae bacterium TAV5]
MSASTESSPPAIIHDATTPSALLELAAPALVPPVLQGSGTSVPPITYPELDYGMTIGTERTRGGRLWVCWVGGGDSEKAFFVLATSDDRGATWSSPRLLINPHDEVRLGMARRVIVGNLWLDPLDRLWLFFDQSMTYYDGRAGIWFTRCDAPDAAIPEWTPPVRIGHGCSLNKPIVLSSGDWLLPASLWDRNKLRHPTSAPFIEAFHELDNERGAGVLASTDQGKTWARRGGVRIPRPNFDEVNLVERRDGSVWLTARSASGDIWQSTSSDRGATWVPPSETGILNVSARHFVRRLRSGRLLLVRHGEQIGVRTEKRSHLAAFLSDDDGLTWRGGLLLDEREGVSYPDGGQFDDGVIFISYDRNRDTDGEVLLALFTEDDVIARTCVSGNSILGRIITRPDPAAVAARHAREACGPGAADMSLPMSAAVCH